MMGGGRKKGKERSWKGIGKEVGRQWKKRICGDRKVRSKKGKGMMCCKNWGKECTVREGRRW